jgi:hypothetical protein
MSDAMRRTAASRRVVAQVKSIQALARDLRAEIPSDLNEGSERVLGADLSTAQARLRFWLDAFRREKKEGKP